MKKIFVLLLLLSQSAFLAAKPIIHYTFDKIENGRVRNKAGKDHPAIIKGKVRITPQKTLYMEGNGVEITLAGTEKLAPQDGMTFMLIYKRRTLPGDKPLDYNHDMFFFRDKHFLFGRTKNRFYTNFCTADKKYVNGSYSQQIIPDDGKFHHFALTFYHHKEPAHGIDQIESRVYMDGLLVHQDNQRNLAMRRAEVPIELASGRMFGTPWRVAGEIADVRIYKRVLSGDEIKKIVSNQTLAAPGFRVPAKLAAADEKLLAQVKAPGVREGLKTLAARGNTLWRKALKDQKKYLITLPGKKSILTLLSAPEHAGIVSWYDTVGKRELLRWDNGFFELILSQKGKNISYPADAPEVKSSWISRPVKNKDKWQFSIGYSHPEWQAVVDFTWQNDRLEYKISPKSKLPIRQLNAPQVKLNCFNRGKGMLLTPDEIGRLLDSTVSSGAAYAGLYPGRRACVQMGAYYDARGGVFLSSGDPLGRMNLLGMSANTGGAEFNFRQSVLPCGGNKSTAVLELFHGDWNDAAVCYINMLDRIKPVWWQKEMVAYPTPAWLKRNTLNVSYAYGNENHQQLKALRKYLELPFIVTVEGSHIRGEKYIPGIRLHPDMASHARDLQKAGINVQIYTNARMIQKYTPHAPENFFKNKILPGAVRQNGQTVFEYYPDTHGNVAVICPSSPVYEGQVHDVSIRFAAQGIDGIYLDQFGCTSALVCEAANHGHKPFDPDAWYLNGQYKKIAALRQMYKEKGFVNKYLSNESCGEIVVSLSDVVTPWGALYDEQVPLFNKIYSSKVQSAFRDRVGENEGAAFAKDAEQILWGEQLGRLNSRNLMSPLRLDYRAYVKRLIHLRTGLLDFLNDGFMDREPRQEPEPVRKPQFWGRFGTRILSRPPVMTAKWNLKGKTAVIAINTTGKKQETTLCFDLEDTASPLVCYSVCGRKTRVKSAKKMRFRCTLEPFACMVLTNAPGKALDQAFKVIAKTLTEKDPFAFDAAKYPDRAFVLNKEYPAIDSSVSGAQRAVARNEINYVYYGVVYPGTLDFGSSKEIRNIDLLLSAPPESGDGRVRIYIDRIEPGNEIFSCPLESNFHTDNWRHYKTLKGKLSRPVTGKHKIFFCFSGSSVCNFRSWKIY